jgi:hypothetical protein
MRERGFIVVVVGHDSGLFVRGVGHVGGGSVEI